MTEPFVLSPYAKLRANGKVLISIKVNPSTLLRRALSNALLSKAEGYDRNLLVQSFLKQD